MIDEIYDLFIWNAVMTPEEYEARVKKGLALAERVRYLYKELYDYSVQRLCFQYVRQGTPVIFWATAGMQEASEGASWTISETGEKYTWIRPMHCLLLVGYDSQNYYFNDPQTDKQYAYDKNDVEKAYEAMGSQAIVILKK